MFSVSCKKAQGRVQKKSNFAPTFPRARFLPLLHPSFLASQGDATFRYCYISPSLVNKPARQHNATPFAVARVHRSPIMTTVSYGLVPEPSQVQEIAGYIARLHDPSERFGDAQILEKFKVLIISSSFRQLSAPCFHYDRAREIGT